MLFLERATLSALILLAPLTGFGVYRLQQSRLETTFGKVGLQDFTASLPGAEVHYWLGGNPDGKPLLLVHGFGGDALWGWAGQAALAKDRMILAPDLLWFGRSHSASDDFSTTYQAQVLLQLLDHLALDQVDLVGISYGGFVALELATLAPGRVDRIVIVDSPGHTYTLDDYRDMLDRLHLESINDLIVPKGPEDVQRLLRLAYHRPPPVPRFVAKDVFTHGFTHWTDQKIRLLDDLLRRADDIDPQDYVVDHPTLVLWGAHDELFPPALGQRLAQHLGARFDLLPRTNHAPNLERPHDFNARISAFFAG